MLLFVKIIPGFDLNITCFVQNEYMWIGPKLKKAGYFEKPKPKGPLWSLKSGQVEII